MIARARDDEQYVSNLLAFYKYNPKTFIEDWCITYDPRRVGARIIPFILFPRQKQFIDFLQSCLRQKENGLTEKARDMGVTWEAVAFGAWLWRFWPGSAIGWGALKAEQVDKQGDLKAIFPKIRLTIRYWPNFLKPRGYSEAKHANYMRILNPENDSSIVAESGDNMGRGGRTTIYFKDESAHYDHPELIEAALGDNTDVQIDISSVNGTNNPFYRRRQAGEVWYPDKPITSGVTQVFIFDWRDHPAKTQEWHDKREKRAEREGMLHVFRQEVDRDYAGSVQGIIIKSEWVEAAIDAHIKLGIKPDGLKCAGQDVADGGGDKNAFVARHGVVLKFADHWGGEAQEAARLAVPLCIEWGIEELYYDSIGVGTGFKGEMNTQQQYDNFPQYLSINPWNAGSSVINPEANVIPDDPKSPTNEDQYLNIKAQGYFMLRTRFYKTYRAVVHGEIYPHEELISIDSTIPCLHELKTQLSQPVADRNDKGKTKVDKMPDGSVSPNLADATVICYTPNRGFTFFDSI